MAEFLIKAINANHSNPIKDASGCYKRGDIVEVYEDGRCLPGMGSEQAHGEERQRPLGQIGREVAWLRYYSGQ